MFGFLLVGKPQARRSHNLHCMYLAEDSGPDYIKKSNKATILKSYKMGKTTVSHSIKLDGHMAQHSSAGNVS